uniref:MIF4G domain-containing protein n=1 Tax=Glossina palpalis gambiensis TaxID=67801 RepID=A0A1B0BX48_9MUSC
MSKTYQPPRQTLHHTIPRMSINEAAFLPNILQQQQQKQKENNCSEQDFYFGKLRHSNVQRSPTQSHLSTAGDRSTAPYSQNRPPQEPKRRRRCSNRKNHDEQQHHYNNNYRFNNHRNRRNCYRQQQQPQAINSESCPTKCTAEMEKIALDYLQCAIQYLNNNTGDLDRISTRFSSMFEGMESNVFVLSNAMEEIFNESMKNANFCYIGAKLYCLLYKLNPQKDSLFYTLLKYQLDFHQNEVKEYKKNNQERKMRETTLFLAELYMQLRGEECHTQFIAERILYSLKRLLTENFENVRCVCLTLKLAGYDLTADSSKGMEDIILELNAIHRRSPGLYPLVSIVIALQENNWGRKVPRSKIPTEDTKLIDSFRYNDGPVFYGPDGSVITKEECEFLTTNGIGISDSTDNVDIDNDYDIVLDPEMDEETERAYIEFTKQSANLRK